MTTRRKFLKTSSLATMAAVGQHTLGVPTVWRPPTTYTPGALPRGTDPQLKELAMRALDAAKSAGASYADVRFTVTRRRTFNGGEAARESETFAVGVRALAKGSWGFSAHSDWTPEIVTQLARDAVEQGQVTAWPHVPPIELIDHPPAAVGNWVTPIKRDPFTVPPEETIAWMRQLATPILTHNPRGRIAIAITFERQERTFASTAGAYTTQTIYTSLGGAPHRQDLPASQIDIMMGGGQYSLPFVTPIGAGYEVLDQARVTDAPEWIERAMEGARAKPFQELGEYDVVFDGAAMGSIVDETFGTALEYDRAVEFESYLAPPLTILSTQQASPLVTITGDRTLARGAATVGWDDDGVAPTAFPLVKDGVVVDYSISRDYVSELAPWYKRHGVPVRSNGCSASESALTVPMVYTPNLVLQPAAQDTSLDALVSGIDNGLLVCGGTVKMDMQQISGRGEGAQVYMIKQGKRAELVSGAVYMFRSQELWKNLVALGGVQTAEQRGVFSSQGEPDQMAVHSVKAVAAHFNKVQVASASRG